MLAFGFGGGTLVLGVLTAVGASFELRALLAAFKGYFLAALPFVVAGVALSLCRRELWFLPGARAFHMLTFRPWLVRGPRVEEARLDEYRALRSDMPDPAMDEPAHVVSLVTVTGESVPVREFDRADEARGFIERLAAVTRLAIEGGDGASGTADT